MLHRALGLLIWSYLVCTILTLYRSQKILNKCKLVHPICIIFKIIGDVGFISPWNKYHSLQKLTKHLMVNHELTSPFLSEIWHRSALPQSIPALLARFQLAVSCTAWVIKAMKEPRITLLSFFHPGVATQIPRAYLEALWSLDLQSPAHWGFTAVGESLE